MNVARTGTFAAYRTTLKLPSSCGTAATAGDAVPTPGTLHIAIDTKYWLYINGELVTFEGGLKRGQSFKLYGVI